MTTDQTTATSRAAYDQWHALHPVDTEADAPWHRLIRTEFDPSRDLAGKTILEIGCGRGGFASWLARTAPPPAEVVGCDFSPVAVEKAVGFAAKLGLRIARFEVADIQNLRFADGEFDTVFSTETVEHVPDPPLAVRELARVLKPGGRLFLTTPNYFSTMGLYRIYCRLRGRTFDEGGQPIAHPNMTFRTRRWVTRAGLRVVRTAGCGHYLPFPGRPPIPLPFLERPRFLMRWVALHSLVVGEKPAAG